MNDAELTEMSGLLMDPLFLATYDEQAFLVGPGGIRGQVTSVPKTEAGSLDPVLKPAMATMIVDLGQAAAPGIEGSDDGPVR